MNPTRQRFGSLAKVYTKDGRSIRVPLQSSQSTTCTACSRQPERQFMQWFTRQSSANPGFPALVKNILLVVPEETTCPACQQSLHRFSQRFRLVGKLQVRNATPKPSHRNTCGCQHTSGFDKDWEAETSVQTELDRMLNWTRTPRGRRVLTGLALLAGSSVLVPQGKDNNSLGQLQGAVQDVAEDDRKRRQNEQQSKLENQAANKLSTRSKQQELSGRPLLDEIMADKFKPEQEFTANDVIDSRIDVHAQYAIQRMLKSPDPTARADGAGMLAAVKSEKLGGIYKEDEYVPAMWARQYGTTWWQLIPPKEDYAVLLTAFSDTEVLPAMIVFRDSIRSNPNRLDPALRKGWAIVQLVLLLKLLAPQLTLAELQAFLLGQPLNLQDQKTYDQVKSGLQQTYGTPAATNSLTAAQKARNCSCGTNMQCLKLPFFCLCLSGSPKPLSFMLRLCSYA